ncbi:PD-(D/E)XK nuclease superfamily protein [methanogenic archaeon mixed culture ISO4-G1]|nr:PD-(D/E)XK nuclease superfamily protein [methanogenic archaeon mixed culture ISO4-G1]
MRETSIEVNDRGEKGRESSTSARDFKMKKTKTIREIYEEAKALNVDLILTNDAALATAINAMVDEPMVGSFAMTPIQMASKHAIDILGEPIWSEVRVIQTISEYTGLDFRYVHGEVDKIKDIARYREDIEQFLTSSSKRVYRNWASLPTLETAMRKFDADNAQIYEGKRIGTIGAQYFNRMDRMMVPTDSQNLDISIFKDGDYRIPKIFGIGNDRQIADNAVKLINPLNPLDYAIVMNRDSGLADAVRSALYREGLPFVNALGVRDLNGIRDFMQMADRCMSYWTLRVRDVRSLFASFGITISSKSDEHLLHKERFWDEKAEALRLLMEETSLYEDQGHGTTFLDLAEKIYDISGMDHRRGLPSIKIVIDDMKLTDELITPQNVSKMEYAVDNVMDLHHNEQIPEDEKRGVLLSDCKSSVFIDRPVVIYLGMEQDWNVDLVKKPYIPCIEDEVDNVADTMSAMLQQGSVRFYLVNRTKEGKTAVPTTMFNEMIKVKPKPIERFSDITDDYREERWYEPQKSGYNVKISDSEEKYVAPFSQSNFSEYVKCPRGFMFKTMLSDPDKAVMEFGTMIHEFAETYASYKREVMEKGLDSFIKQSCDRFSGLSTPLLDEFDKERIRCAVVNITRFMDQMGLGDPGDDEWKDADTKYGGNWYYVNSFDEPKTKTYSECEDDKDSNEHRIHGKMDLKHGNTVIDYKTGGAKSGSEIVKNFQLDKLVRHPDYQCLFYLAVAYELYHSDTFQFFFVMDNDLEYMDPDYDIRRNLRTVKLIDRDVESLKRDPLVLDAFESGTAYNAKFKGMSDQFIDILLENSSGDMSTWADPNINIRAYNALSDKFCSEDGMDPDTFTNNVNRYVGLITAPVIASSTTVYVQKKYLDEFLNKVDKMHAEMSEDSKRVGGLMPFPKTNCRYCKYFSVCMIDRNDEGAVE